MPLTLIVKGFTAVFLKIKMTELQMVQAVHPQYLVINLMSMYFVTVIFLSTSFKYTAFIVWLAFNGQACIYITFTADEEDKASAWN